MTYQITDELTEDTYDSVTNIDEAIRIAKEVAQQTSDNLVNVESDGYVVKQFVFKDGKVIELL